MGKQTSLVWASGSLIFRHAEDPTSLQLEIFLHSFTTYSTRLGMFCDQEEEEEEEEATAVAAAAAAAEDTSMDAEWTLLQLLFFTQARPPLASLCNHRGPKSKGSA